MPTGPMPPRPPYPGEFMPRAQDGFAALLESLPSYMQNAQAMKMKQADVATRGMEQKLQFAKEDQEAKYRAEQKAEWEKREAERKMREERERMEALANQEKQQKLQTLQMANSERGSGAIAYNTMGPSQYGNMADMYRYGKL